MQTSVQPKDFVEPVGTGTGTDRVVLVDTGIATICHLWIGKDRVRCSDVPASLVRPDREGPPCRAGLRTSTRLKRSCWVSLPAGCRQTRSRGAGQRESSRQKQNTASPPIRHLVGGGDKTTHYPSYLHTRTLVHAHTPFYTQ